MKFLLDTHLLIWAAEGSPKLPAKVRDLIENGGHESFFSSASIWEVVLKRSHQPVAFSVNPRPFRRGLLDNGYQELPITGTHALALDSLPPIHKDPFDRILVAQAQSEGFILLTVDPLVAQYGALVWSF